MQSDFVTDEIPEKQTSVALGVFDGVHKGHRIVLKEAAAIDYLEPWVFTFSEDALPTSKKDALRLEPAKFRYRIIPATRTGKIKSSRQQQLPPKSDHISLAYIFSGIITKNSLEVSACRGFPSVL